jgi:hypothetical protein
MKFTINGREYEDYELRNGQIVDLIENGDLSSDEMDCLNKKVYQKFKLLCPRNGETNDNVFVRFFSDFVNGKMNSQTKVAKLMCNEHRYLQNEMFKVCMEFIKQLGENFENGRYDGRNKYACETANKIIDNLKEIDWPY